MHLTRSPPQSKQMGMQSLGKVKKKRRPTHDSLLAKMGGAAPAPDSLPAPSGTRSASGGDTGGGGGGGSGGGTPWSQTEQMQVRVRSL